MRKIICAFLPALFPLLLTGCNVKEMSSLRDVSKPYVGEYQCEKLTLGGNDMLGRFEYVRLNLEYDGKFTLSYCGENGSKGKFGGEYDFGENGVTFTADYGQIYESRTFPYEKGVLYIEYPFGGTLLHAEFTP